MKRVAVVDFGLGNLFSVCRAIETVGYSPTLATRQRDLSGADALVLPGVGAFDEAMRSLASLDLVEPLAEFAQSGRPFLGVCLGMQLLLTSSEEHGRHEGLGLIAGSVERIPSTTSAGQPLRVPHIGWSPVFLTENADPDSGPLHIVPNGTAMYFVHSYRVSTSSENIVATSDYGGHQITAAIRDKNVFGVQFHPERSSDAGLSIYQQIFALSEIRIAK